MEQSTIKSYAVSDTITGNVLIIKSNGDKIYKTKGHAQRVCDEWNKRLNTNRLQVVRLKRGSCGWKIDID